MGLLDMIRSIKEPRKKVYDLGDLVNKGMNWQKVLEPGDYITRVVYDYIREHCRVRGCTDFLSGKVTPEYYQVITDEHICGSYVCGGESRVGELYHTFDFDIVNQEYYIYHGMCFINGVTNIDSREHFS